MSPMIEEAQTKQRRKEEAAQKFVLGIAAGLLKVSDPEEYYQALHTIQKDNFLQVIEALRPDDP